ncbi:AAA family ATPase [Fusibacter sp. JL298sf-3]
MLETIKGEIKKSVVGKEAAIESIMIALLTGGHILIEDLPGTGKTTLAKSFAKVLNCTFKRVQFTPDLMPSDLMGVSIYDKEKQSFVFQKGPLFTNILLADEINRTSPKTQSSLLESMEETQVTIDGKTHVLESPFLVIATENPIELQGTFPLPEAQLDRFMMRIALGYPSPEEEMAILTMKEAAAPLEGVVTLEALNKAQRTMSKVFVKEAVKAYIVKLCAATRTHPSVKLGASPRASVHLFSGAKAKAYLSGRDYVLPSDIKSIFKSVIAHRLILKGEAVYKGIDAEKVVDEVLATTEVPKVTE